MTIGERIKQVRKEKGISQKELGAILGCKQQNLAQYENSKRNMNVNSLLKIAEALHVPASSLIDEPRPTTFTDHKEARLNQLQEECGELTSTAARLRRHLHGDRTLNERYTERKLIADLTEEMADVILVASDVRREFNISEEELFEVINAKMKRTEKRS